MRNISASTEERRALAAAALFPPGVAVRTGFAAGAGESPYAAESTIVSAAVAQRRQEFFAGRALAREALASLGAAPAALLRGADRAPIWPKGLVGSISHSEGFCCAAAARARDFAALGVDVESAAPLSSALVRRICTERELAHFERRGGLPIAVWAKLAFSAKEAIYKAWSTLTHRPLDFHDVEVQFRSDDVGAAGAFIATSQQPDPTLANVSGRWRFADGRIHCGAHLRA